MIHKKIDCLEILYTGYVWLDNWIFQKKLAKMLMLTDLSALEKTGHFGLLFSLETLNSCLWLDSNPRPFAPQSDLYTTIPNCLAEKISKILSQMLKYFYNLSVSESPVGSSSNRRFRLKRQKTKNANNFWCRPYICMKLSGCMRNYIVYDISLIFLMRQLFDKKVKYTTKHWAWFKANQFFRESH